MQLLLQWKSNVLHIVSNYFDVLLAVHCSNDQFWFQLMHHNFTLLTKSLYMFRAPTCPSSGGQTIRGVTGGTDQTSGECSLGHTIPI